MLKQFLKSMIIAKEKRKKHFNKNLVMSGGFKQNVNV